MEQMDERERSLFSVSGRGESMQMPLSDDMRLVRLARGDWRGHGEGGRTRRGELGEISVVGSLLLVPGGSTYSETLLSLLDAPAGEGDVRPAFFGDAGRTVGLMAGRLMRPRRARSAAEASSCDMDASTGSCDTWTVTRSRAASVRGDRRSRGGSSRGCDCGDLGSVPIARRGESGVFGGFTFVSEGLERGEPALRSCVEDERLPGSDARRGDMGAMRRSACDTLCSFLHLSRRSFILSTSFSSHLYRCCMLSRRAFSRRISACSRTLSRRFLSFKPPCVIFESAGEFDGVISRIRSSRRVVICVQVGCSSSSCASVAFFSARSNDLVPMYSALI
eukprot:Opistho-1_new@29358